MVLGCEGSADRGSARIASGWSGSWRIETARKSMSGGLEWCWLTRGRAVAPRRSCAGRGLSKPCGLAVAGALSCAKAWTGCCATRPGSRGSCALSAGRGRAEVIAPDAGRAPPGETTHWTVRAMAEVERHLAALRVQRDLAGARVWQPHRVRRFKLSTDPAFAEQAWRRRRPVHRSARTQPGALARREVADPGARPHASRAADEEGPRRHHDA